MKMDLNQIQLWGDTVDSFQTIHEPKHLNMHTSIPKQVWTQLSNKFETR